MNRLMRSFLLPYKNLLIAVFLLQIVAVGATMILPTLNAMLIDQGILTGNTNYILKIGVVMKVVTAVTRKTASVMPAISQRYLLAMRRYL